jgi:hypothetical protein
MLKKLFFASLFLFSVSAFACWKVEGSFAVDGDSWKINNKFDHNRDYSFPMGTFILTMKIRTEEDKTQTLVYKVQEKKGTTLILVTEGEEEAIKAGESRDVYAKGKEGQPNSIITVKLTNI